MHKHKRYFSKPKSKTNIDLLLIIEQFYDLKSFKMHQFKRYN